VRMEYLSKDGEEGYPGNLNVIAIFTLTKSENNLNMLFTATCDRATPVNLTDHCYFNLDGQGNGDIMEHGFFFNANGFTILNEELITTGEIVTIKDTPFDFCEESGITLNSMISRFPHSPHIVIANGGYDHNLVLNKEEEEKTTTLATIVYNSDKSMCMKVFTDQDCIQFYTGNFLDGSIIGKEEKVYQQRSGFCLETQAIPNSVNHSHFPTTILTPGQVYQNHTIYSFN